MKIKREQVDRARARLNFDLAQRREDIRQAAPKDFQESPERFEKRRVTIASESGNPREARRRFERIIKGDDLININYLEKGRIAAKAVARILVKEAAGELQGCGTGFLVAPGVLLTNNHVLENEAVAGSSEVEFDYELDVFGNERPTHIFALEPQRLFLTSVDLDFTCVAVAPVAMKTGGDLADYHWLPLIAEEGKVLTAEYVSIIQHPGGQRKQVAVRENKVLKIEGDAVWYATDTLQGSSGSPVFNNDWQVVALHHLGIPRTDEHGNWLTKDGRIWTEAIDESQVDWIANEGIRVSPIVTRMRAEKSEHPLLRPIFEGRMPVEKTPTSRRPRPVSLRGGGGHLRGQPQIATPAHDGVPGSDGEVGMEVPLRIQVSLGDGEGRPGVVLSEAIRIEPDDKKGRGDAAAFPGEGRRRGVAEPRNHGRFSGEPVTQWICNPEAPDREMRLQEDFWYEDPNGRRWMASKGSVVNGASIPRALWSSVGSPYTEDYRCASIVHDVACGTAGVSRKEADEMFYYACLAGGCSLPQARMLYAGVRVGAWSGSLGDMFGRGREAAWVRAATSEAVQMLEKTKFDQIAAHLDDGRREVSFKELDRIVEETLPSSGAGLGAAEPPVAAY